MLTPEQLAKLQEHLIPLYHELEDFILEDIARRIKKAGQVTDTAKWQAEMSKEIGIGLKRIEEEVARINGMAIEEVEKLFNEAALTSLKGEVALYEKAGLNPLTLENSPLLNQYLQAAIKQTQEELINITRSMGFATTVGGKVTYQPIAKAYHNALDLAQFQISSGVLDYNAAVKRAVKSLCDSGVRYVDYESGWSNRVDVAIRRATLTGGNQMSTQMTIANMEHLGIEYVETTAHAGARPDHQSWQGQVFCYKGKDMKYPDFVDSTGYGHGDGICGWNCRHTFHPFIPNISTRAYSDADLERIKELDERVIEFNNKHYNLYQATQKQRQIETAIRKTKRELIGYNATELKDEFNNASIKLQRQKQYYIEFSKAAGLPLQNERHQVYQFDKSIAQKAVQANKKFEKEVQKQYNRGNKEYSVTDYLKDRPVIEKLNQYNINFVERINDKESIVTLKTPTISGVRKHFSDNLEQKADRRELTVERALEFIDNAKLVLYQENRDVLKFLSEKGYTILNLECEVVTAVPQKWRKKYDKYLKEE